MVRHQARIESGAGPFEGSPGPVAPEGVDPGAHVSVRQGRVELVPAVAAGAKTGRPVGSNRGAEVAMDDEVVHLAVHEEIAAPGSPSQRHRQNGVAAAKGRHHAGVACCDRKHGLPAIREERLQRLVREHPPRLGPDRCSVEAEIQKT